MDGNLDNKIITLSMEQNFYAFKRRKEKITIKKSKPVLSGEIFHQMVDQEEKFEEETNKQIFRNEEEEDNKNKYKSINPNSHFNQDKIQLVQPKIISKTDENYMVKRIYSPKPEILIDEVKKFEDEFETLKLLDPNRTINLSIYLGKVGTLGVVELFNLYYPKGLYDELGASIILYIKEIKEQVPNFENISKMFGLFFSSILFFDKKAFSLLQIVFRRICPCCDYKWDGNTDEIKDLDLFRFCLTLYIQVLNHIPKYFAVFGELYFQNILGIIMKDKDNEFALSCMLNIIKICSESLFIFDRKHTMEHIYSLKNKIFSGPYSKIEYILTLKTISSSMKKTLFQLYNIISKVLE